MGIGKKNLSPDESEKSLCHEFLTSISRLCHICEDSRCRMEKYDSVSLATAQENRQRQSSYGKIRYLMIRLGGDAEQVSKKQLDMLEVSLMWRKETGSPVNVGWPAKETDTKALHHALGVPEGTTSQGGEMRVAKRGSLLQVFSHCWVDLKEQGSISFREDWVHIAGVWLYMCICL